MEKKYLKMLVVAASTLAPQLIVQSAESMQFIPLEKLKQAKILPLEDNHVFFVYELSKEEFEKQITHLSHEEKQLS